MHPEWRSRSGLGDSASLAGIPIGIGLVLAGQAIEGGTVGTLLQGAAGLIVFGGTLGAVLLSFSADDVWRAAVSLRTVFADQLEPAAAAIGRLTRYATKARRLGVLSLEVDLDEEPDPFLAHAMTLAVEGASQAQLRSAMEVEMDTLEELDDRPARVFDAAGGYAPTVGILGAVLGLIHVMEHLTEPARLGPGIAVAFVATVYGVGSANLLLLPIATKLRQRARTAARRRELLLDGVLAIQDGLNPRLLERRLHSFVDGCAAPRRDLPPAPQKVTG